MVKQYRLEYSTQARKDLQSFDQVVAGRIVKKLDKNIHLSDPLQRAKALVGELQGSYRYRIGNYRAIFIVTKDNQLVLLTILNIEHRSKIYR